MASKSSWKWKIIFCALLHSFYIFLYVVSSYAKPVDLSPAWRNEISQQASSYAQRVVLPFVAKQLNNLRVSGVSGDVDTPLGGVDFNLRNIKISNVSIHKANISLNSGHSVHMSTDQASLNIGADWNYKEKAWPHISDSGSCILNIGDLSLGLSFLITGRNISKKHGTVGVNDCKLRIGSLQIRFQGGASWLYNLFSNEISMDLKKQLQKQICKSALNIIDSKANRLLASLPGMVEAMKEIGKS